MDLRGGNQMSANEGLASLRDWCAKRTVLEVLALSFSNWPLWRKVHIASVTEDPALLNLVEEPSNQPLPPLDLENAEIRWAESEEGPWPFEDVDPAEFKSFLFLKLRDGKHLVLAEPQ